MNQNMQEKYCWVDYIADQNPYGVNRVLYKYGYFPPQNHAETVEAAYMLVEEQGEKAIRDLMRVHPDAEMIRDVFGVDKRGYRANGYAPQGYNYATGGDMDVDLSNEPTHQTGPAPQPNVWDKLNEVIRGARTNQEFIKTALTVAITIVAVRALDQKS